MEYEIRIKVRANIPDTRSLVHVASRVRRAVTDLANARREDAGILTVQEVRIIPGKSTT